MWFSSMQVEIYTYLFYLSASKTTYLRLTKEIENADVC